MRAKERDLLYLQLKYPEEDFCYPIPREVDDLWSAPSDGGSQWMYLDFGHFYFEYTSALVLVVFAAGENPFTRRGLEGLGY